jgi:flagellar hook-associated protein 2
MSSPITFSGFNNIDFNTVVNSLMQQASIPLTNLQTDQKNLQTRVTGFDTLSSNVSALSSAAQALTQPGNLSTLTGTSSNAQAVGVSVNSSATAGQYDIVVNELARAQVTVSASSAPDANTTIVAGAGTLTIGGVAVTVAGDVTLQQLATTINGTAGIGVTAAVLKTGPSTYRLTLSGTSSGQANGFTIANALSGGTGVTFTDTDQDGLSGNSAADNAVSATDASLLFNNVLITGDSNTFADIVPGVTLTVMKKDPAATVQVGVATDGTALKGTITDFITAYNTLAGFVADQRASAAKGDATSIGREPILRQLYNGLRTAMVGAHGTGPLTRLAEAGIEFTQSGQLKLNDQVFNAAIATGADDVRTLFSDATGGAFTGVTALLDGFSQADGIIPSGKKRLQTQIDTMTSQIDAMTSRLALQRQALQKQFSDADAIMSRLNGQAGSLSNLASNWGTLTK